MRKMRSGWKGRIKQSLQLASSEGCVFDENPQEPTKKKRHLEQMNEFIKTVGYKVSTQKLVLFVYL